MILNIVIQIKESANRQEADFAIREAGRVASNDVYLNGIPRIDEQRTLIESMLGDCVIDASYNRSE